MSFDFDLDAGGNGPKPQIITISPEAQAAYTQRYVDETGTLLATLDAIKPAQLVSRFICEQAAHAEGEPARDCRLEIRQQVVDPLASLTASKMGEILPQTWIVECLNGGTCLSPNTPQLCVTQLLHEIGLPEESKES